MLKIIIPTTMLILTTLLTQQKLLWTSITAHSMLIATLSLQGLTPTYHS